MTIKYSLNEHFFVRASYARGFRAPSLKELYLNFDDSNHKIFGNADLDAEHSHNINVSAVFFSNREHRTLKLEPSVFYNNIYDQIALATTGVEISNIPEFRYLNIDRFKSYGARLQSSYQIHPDFGFNLGVASVSTGSTASFDDPNVSDYYTSPEVSASFNYWRASKKFSFNIYYKYTGKSRFLYEEINEQNNALELRQGLIDPYHLLDLTVNQKLWKDRFILGLGLKNILDVKTLNTSGTGGNVHSSGSGSVNQAWGRTFVVTLKLNWGKDVGKK